MIWVYRCLDLPDQERTGVRAGTPHIGFLEVAKGRFGNVYVHGHALTRRREQPLAHHRCRRTGARANCDRCAARLLQGKHKASYTPFIDTGDHVVVVNAAKVKLTGRKEDQKIYRQH